MEGRAHVAAITDTGSKILGQRDLELDGLPGLLQVSHRGGGTVWLYEGRTPPRRNRPGAANTARHASVGPGK